MHEANPMMGMRGVRLGLVLPGLYGLQVRAMAEATADRIAAGGSPRPEIMVPLVAARTELALVRDEAERVIALVAEERGCRSGDPDRHDDRATASGGARRRPRPRRRVLLVRQQRPDADHVGLQPRRRRGRLFHRPTSTRTSSVSRRSRRSTPTASGPSSGWRPRRDGRCDPR